MSGKRPLKERVKFIFAVFVSSCIPFVVLDLVDNAFLLAETINDPSVEELYETSIWIDAIVISILAAAGISLLRKGRKDQ